MKAPLTECRCIAKSCGWVERTHKQYDGIKCPKCGGPVWTKYVKKQGREQKE